MEIQDKPGEMDHLVSFLDTSFRQKILNSMKCPPSFSKALVVVSHPEELKPEFVATVLGKYDEKVDIRDRWMSPDSSTTKKYWCGAIAIYNCEVKAKLAAKELRMLTRSIKTIMFPDFLNVFTETEVRHYSISHHQGICVVIRGKMCLTNAHVNHLMNCLRQFGKLKRVKFNDFGTEYGTICEAYYEYVTQAIAASTILNGLSYSKVGFITVELERTRKIKKFMQYATGVMVEFMNEEDPRPLPNCCDACVIRQKDLTQDNS